ncbi:hypothetical protein CYY_006605 [Polysphondylium violaceum]|uniref:Protein kinase domain-containing protein n=1 Tax=Polysphondylium violaceum TaxID=133409 RepID=A0A8J4PQ29_9MYCE|nr:hypothetical protein CYY_006605 [Polysphondylium violaceum]
MFLRKLFIKSDTGKFKRFGQQMIQDKQLSESNLKEWIKLFRIQDDKYIRMFRYYHIFNNMPISQEIFDFLITLIISGDFSISSSLSYHNTEYQEVSTILPRSSSKRKKLKQMASETSSDSEEEEEELNTSRGVDNISRKSSLILTSTNFTKYKLNTQFIGLAILYRIIFNQQNINYFISKQHLSSLGTLYQSYIQHLKTTDDQLLMNYISNNSSRLLSIFFKLLDQETLLPMFFNCNLIESISRLTLEKPNLSGKLIQQDLDMSDKFVEFLSKHYNQEPYHSIIESKPEWIDLMISYSAKQKVGLIHQELTEGMVEFGDSVYDSPLCTVYKGHFNGLEVAIKQFSVEGISFEWPLFFKEVAIICVTQHPKVIRVYGAHTIKTDRPFIVTEFCHRGNIQQSLANYKVETGNSPPVPLLVNMAVDAAQSMAFIHSKSIIHRDVKTANFLVNKDWNVKLIDFGISRVMQTQLNMTVIGTPVYMSEEVIRGEQYTQSADVYSFGIVLWEMFTQETPFKSLTDYQRVNFVLEGGRLEIPTTVPSKIAHFIQLCWARDPTVRPTFRKILDFFYSLLNPSPENHRMVPVVTRFNDSPLPRIIFSYLDKVSMSNYGLASREMRSCLHRTIHSNPSMNENYWTELLDYTLHKYYNQQHQLQIQ